MIKVDLIRKSKYSRPKTKISDIKGIVFHWVANPKQSAQGVRNYFDMKSKETFSSAHYCIDDNEIIRCIPENEMAYHVGARAYNKELLERLDITYPNAHMIGIELCHDDWTGKFSESVLDQAVELGAYLMIEYGLESNQIFRHYDITYKNCPKYFVENPDEWKAFYTRIIERAKELT